MLAETISQERNDLQIRQKAQNQVYNFYQDFEIEAHISISVLSSA